MENRKQYKALVEVKYKELHDYSKLYNKISTEQRTKLLEEHKEAFEKDPNSVDLEAIAKNMFYMNGFYQTDIRKMQIQFVDIYNTVKYCHSDIEFSTDLEESVQALKSILQKQLFIVVDGDFKEIEEGQIDKLRSDFDKKNYYSLFEKQVKQILNG